MISDNLSEILSQVGKLDKADQAFLLKRITTIVKKNQPLSGSIRLSQLSRLGSSIWQGVDIDKYVDEERQW